MCFSEIEYLRSKVNHLKSNRFKPAFQSQIHIFSHDMKDKQEFRKKGNEVAPVTMHQRDFPHSF